MSRMRSPGKIARRSLRRCTNLPSRLIEGFTNDSWKRKGSRSRHTLTAKRSAMFQHRKTTTTDCKGCSSTPRKANQVPTTTTKVRKTTRTKDLSRRRKGLPTSPASSATAVARKATIRTNAMPGSSVMTCKDPASTKPRTILFEQ
jgi:hypothetical protein